MKIYEVRGSASGFVLKVERDPWICARRRGTATAALANAGFTSKAFGFNKILKIRSLNTPGGHKKLYITTSK